MNIFCFEFVLYLLSIIVVIDVRYGRSHRRDYRPRLSYYSNDDNNEYDHQNDHDYPIHIPHHLEIYTKIGPGYHRRGPKTRASTIALKNSDYARPGCYQPNAEVHIDRMYRHPRNESCYTTYREGNVYCFNRQLPEPRTVSSSTMARKINPLYYQICPKARARTTIPCYTPEFRMSLKQKHYMHPNNASCLVSYDSGEVFCLLENKYVLQEPSEEKNGNVLYTPLYQVLCSTYCSSVLPDQCRSTRPLPCTVCAESMITENGCYSPEANTHIGLFYEHPRNYWNDSCVVSYKEGNVYCHGSQQPEPRRIPDPEYIRKAYNDISREVPNPLYKQICSKAKARTTMPCYTPPEPKSALEKHYQHPTSRHCVVSYDSGDIICDDVLQERSIDSDGREVDAPLYREVCSFYCHKLLPIQCTSIRPKNCMVCDGQDES